MARYHVWSIGCQMNTADARELAEELELCGLEKGKGPEDSDVVVLYTCVVRQSAENKVLSELGVLQKIKARRPQMRVALAGCMAEEDSRGLQRRFPFVDIFASPRLDVSLKDRILDLIDLDERYRVRPQDVHGNPGVSVGVTIHQGCNRRCTYCIIPYRRGPERSRPPQVVNREVSQLARRGAREVVLLSQIVDRYGLDLAPKYPLSRLLGDLDAIPELYRIRFLTSFPKAFGDDLIEVVATLPKVCEDINLPIQAGDDDVLRAMKRGYTVDYYRRKLADIRRAIPEVGISTDVIVGFPGETEAQFLNTLAVLEEMRFDVVHVAMFSPRSGTPAAAMADDIPRAEKKRRLHAVEEVQARIAAEINAGLIGRTVEVLVEGLSKGRWYGRTRTNKLLFFDPTNGLDLTGKLVHVRIQAASPWSLQGVLSLVAQKMSA